ncbi:opt family small oligopeptide transporter [Gigaspora margarita]|uniref:Opt family small oligopeptide transporter n=1 Tax=Gigaspora margarita TaxID=4874 RepID=A0A8H4A3C7_GIGMA|nr:opt family small oligopeptide transporter [Gigaspora margarita]
MAETKIDDNVKDLVYNLGEKNIEIESQDGSEVELISAAVSTNDDPSLPCLTFRFWVLSTFFTALGASISVFYYFRANVLLYSILFVILASFIAGRFLEKILPTKNFHIRRWRFSINPGKFNYKEHVCVGASATAGGVAAYALEIISIQELFYNTKINFLVGFMLLISTQMIGYGMAGFVRKYLVRPTNMIWPRSLVFVAMYNTLHRNNTEAEDKIRFFYIAFILIFIWQFIPQYMFPWLVSAAILCLISPNNNVVKTLGSAYRGAGLLVFSFDWNAIGTIDPLYTPWWSQVNNFIGLILSIWVIAPLLYYYNVFNAQKFPFTSTHSFDKDGNVYNQTRVIKSGELDITEYENYSPVFMSTILALSYGCNFMQLPSTIVHVALFHGKGIWNQYKKTRKEEERDDIHCNMMSIYPEVPYYWYGGIFFVMLIIAMILGETTGAHLPWWGVLLSVFLALLMVIPIGIIQAISNWQIGLNVLTELVCGFILPGRPIANVYFKTYGYMSLAQCLLFVQDLKLGHYMKVPPRSMFISQIWGTFIGCIVNYWMLQFIINTKRTYLNGTELDPSGQWTAYQTEIFNTASIIWGLIGPVRTFGPGSIYNVLLWGFLIGGFLPIPFYLLHRKFPKARFNLVNIPVIFNGLTTFPGPAANFLITGFVVSFSSQFYAFRYKHKWWEKYNYVMSAAFDAGTQTMTIVVYICFTVIGQVQFPTWWGNDPTTQSEHCFALNNQKN